jgi:hypothetical protein
MEKLTDLGLVSTVNRAQTARNETIVSRWRELLPGRTISNALDPFSIKASTVQRVSRSQSNDFAVHVECHATLGDNVVSNVP